MKNDRILKTVKDLLALAEDDERHVEESHSAFLKAQKLMVKYGIDPKEITDNEETIEILEQSGTEYKRLFWWERRLATIVAKNFRCKSFIRWKKFKEKKQKQNKIMFMGRDSDVELASEMYKLAIDAVLFYTKRYMSQYKLTGADVKNDYILGFVDGLEEKFEEQIAEQEWGLVLVVPKEVEEKYAEEVTGRATPMSIPDLTSHEHYHTGFKDGNSIDYKKETIDEDGYRGDSNV